MLPYCKCICQKVSSPDGNLSGVLAYRRWRSNLSSVIQRGKQVIKPSTLGIGVGWRTPWWINSASIRLLHLPSMRHGNQYGVGERIRNHYNELFVEMEKPSMVGLWDLRFRVYNDGVGSAMSFLSNGSSYFVVKAEHTRFALTGDHRHGGFPGDYDTQEYDYTESKLSEIRGLLQGAVSSNASQTIFSPTGVQTSLQMKTADGIYINIHEAALVDYSCMHLNLDDKNLVFTSLSLPLMHKATWLTCRPHAILHGAPSW